MKDIKKLPKQELSEDELYLILEETICNICSSKTLYEIIGILEILKQNLIIRSTK